MSVEDLHLQLHMSAADVAETLESLCEMGLIEAFQLEGEDEPRYRILIAPHAQADDSSGMVEQAY